MKKSGFTLIELLITLALIAILSLLSIASSTLFIRKNEQQVIVDEIRAAVQYAKLQAVNRGGEVFLSPLDQSLDWSRGVVLTEANKKEILYQWQWHHPHWVLSWSGVRSSHKITFSNNPINSISNGRFQLTHVDAKKPINIVLNRLGRIRIMD